MKKTSFIYFFCFINIFLYSQHVNWNILDAGSRAAGMGGACIAVADDATAIVWNPAGLSQLDRAELYCDISGIIEKKVDVDFDYDSYSLTIETIEYNQKHISPNFLGIAYPFGTGNNIIVGALALQNQLDMYNSRDTYPIGSPIHSSGGAKSITFGLVT